jgi:hypothetical protein
MDLRIGILCDSFKFKRWQQEIIDQIFQTPGLELSLLILNEQQASKQSINKLGYRALTYVDRKLFKVQHDAFQIRDIKEAVREVVVLRVDPKPLKFGVKFPPEDVTEVESYDLDVLIRFGFGIIKGGVLKAARFGVWSLHHGDNKVNRGGPPGFWEVVNSEPITGVTLQKISADLDGGKVLRKSFVKTDSTSFYRNQNAAFWTGVELMCSSLKDLRDGRLSLSTNEPSEQFMFYSYPLYKDPGNIKSFRIFCSFWARRLKEAFKEKFLTPGWSLAYKFSQNNKVETSIFRYKNLLPPKGFEWADPFVVFEEQHYYVFIEELEKKKKNAHLSYLKFDAQGELLTPNAIKVIEEDFHLSYPFIFKEDGAYYMMPEMAGSNEVWIYKASSFPNKWEKFHLLFEDKQLFDPSLYFHENTWYLFGTEKTNIGSSRDQFLSIYFSEDLFGGKWVPHPLNPVTRDVRGARPAGKIFNWDSKLIRPGQIGAPNYGYGIQFHEIIKLSKTEFVERAIDVLVPEWTDKIKAVHTLNFEKGFSIIDIQGTKI